MFKCESLTFDFSMIGLEDNEKSNNAFIKILAHTLSDPEQVESANSSGDIQKNISHFLPLAVWRLDSNIWKGMRIFGVNSEGSVLSISLHGNKYGLRYFGIEENSCEFRLIFQNELSSTPSDDDLVRAKQLSEFVRQYSPAEVGKSKFIRLWNGRIYDSLEMISKIRQLVKNKLCRPDKLIMFEKAPLLNARDAVGNLAPLVETPENAVSFEAALTPRTSWIKSIHYPAAEWRTFTSEMKIIADNILENEDRTSRSDHFCLFISYELEKRVCVNQLEVFSSCIKMFSERYSHMKILVNGLTGPSRGGDKDFCRDIHTAELAITEQIHLHCPTVEIVDMFGWSLRQKLMETSKCNLYIAPAGNACLIPILAGTPGIYYNVKENLSNYTIYADLSKGKSQMLPTEFVKSIESDLAMRKVSFGLEDGSRISYELDTKGLLSFIDSLDRPRA